MKRFIKWFISIALIFLVLAGVIGGIYFKDRLWLIAKYFESGQKSPIEIAKEEDPQFSPVDLTVRANEAYEYAKKQWL